MSSNTKRAFIHFGRSWYARHNNHRDGMIDMVTFGDWHEDGSGDSEISLVWYKEGPRLECFSGSWAGLANMPTVIAVLGAMDGYKLTPLEFCEILIALDFEDRTPADRLGGIVPMPEGRSDIVNVVVSRIMDAAEPASLADEILNVQQLLEVAPQPIHDPLVSIGDVLYYYATWGDSLAMDMGEGWFVCTVTGRPSATSAEVLFQVTDGTREREVETRRLYSEISSRPAVVVNERAYDASRPRYYHSSDYGWLAVTVQNFGRTLASVQAWHQGKLLISQDISRAELHLALPDGVIAWNVPTLGERQNGMADWIICPNCETGMSEPATADPLITCWQCHFVYIRPARQEGDSNAM